MEFIVNLVTSPAKPASYHLSSYRGRSILPLFLINFRLKTKVSISGLMYTDINFFLEAGIVKTTPSWPFSWSPLLYAAFEITSVFISFFPFFFRHCRFLQYAEFRRKLNYSSVFPWSTSFSIFFAFFSICSISAEIRQFPYLAAIFIIKSPCFFSYSKASAFTPSSVIFGNFSARAFTERQSWMLPDLSVQMKTTNAPQLKIN